MEEIIYAKALYELKFTLYNYKCDKGSIEKFILVPKNNSTEVTIFLVCEIDDEEIKMPVNRKGFDHSFDIIGNINDLMNYLEVNK